MSEADNQSQPAPSKVRVFVGHAGSFVGNLVASLIRGVLRWKETTIFLPLAIGLFALICLAVILLTGRQLLTDLGDLVDFGKACVKLAIIIAMVGWAQESLVGYRTESGPKVSTKASIWDDVHDSCVTLGLLFLFIYSVAFWL